VTRKDPRVQDAWTWLRANWDVEQNPRMGLDGLYYYYHTMSKTLAVWGERIVVDAHGQPHRWSEELSQAIIKRQSPDGSWVNTDARWRENNPVMVTGYSLISLGHCAALG
jgi:squalene-hopene/tetraprenyl-beta-curcumene cyclase